MAKNYGVFDILGPVMIGPSSSHTAGAARLGRIAANIAGSDIKKVTFLLHGSFAKTYKGHGTDKALLAGVLGFEPHDERLRDSFIIASKEGLEYEFIESDLGDVHPNTVKFLFEKSNGTAFTVTGSSIGGGNVLIKEVNGEEVEFTGEYPTIITKHYDRPGVITAVTSLLSELKVNIAFMKVIRKSKGQMASMVVETDNPIPDEAIEGISKIKDIEKVFLVKPI
ncbi:L-serine dehydratase, beta chain [Oxobacter pfennigii]|uniref:L-serine deaminase n=1 Tax=Oxobacter pfennigii TaxID=36849 RepID=A0A0P9AI73_9CLOT|nr:L-serine ammonia-lyase, iron-sulfur-dependent subunit beta [Oxobacter pfennigii]KPU45162.1 L-serine dehydratase, beta chain [Oxobacter pfennigii]